MGSGHRKRSSPSIVVPSLSPCIENKTKASHFDFNAWDKKGTGFLKTQNEQETSQEKNFTVPKIFVDSVDYGRYDTCWFKNLSLFSFLFFFSFFSFLFFIFSHIKIFFIVIKIIPLVLVYVLRVIFVFWKIIIHVALSICCLSDISVVCKFSFVC